MTSQLSHSCDVTTIQPLFSAFANTLAELRKKLGLPLRPVRDDQSEHTGLTGGGL